MKRISFVGLILAVLVAVPALAGGNKTGGGYEVLMDTANARGGYASGGTYEAFSSVGQRVSSDPVSAGAYELIAGFAGVIDTTSPSLAITGPTAGSAQTAAISVVGTAFDQNDVQWTLYLGPGASPSSWSQLATGAGNQASSYTFGSWDSSNYTGDYTFRVTAVDGHGNTTEATVTVGTGGTVTITGTVPKLKWVFLGMPLVPNSTTPTDIFGTGEYKVFRWDPEVASDEYLDQYRYPSAISAGEGFWIKAYFNDLSYSYTGATIETNTTYSLSLKAGWNQITTPYNDGFTWDSVQVSYGGNTYDLTTAAGMGLINSTIYSYNDTTQSWEPVAGGGAMQPEGGYYCRAYQDLDLVFDQSARVLSRVVRPVRDYSVTIAAAAGGAADTHTTLAAQSLADAEYDKWDAADPPRSVGQLEDGYVSMYFANNAWGRNAGRYAADTRPSAPEVGHTEAWNAVVETDRTGETVTLSWDAAALPMDRFSFTLIHQDTGARINMAAQNSYTYTAAGDGVSQANFKIEVVKLNTDASVTKTHTLSPGWNLISVPIEPEVTGALAQLGDDLPLLGVYQYYDGAFYAAEAADIQAGLGYWVHVADNTEIDVTGLPVADTITVPLAVGWNIIGNPFETSLAWDDSVTVSCGDEDFTLTDAAASGRIGDKVFQFDGEDYAPLSGGTLAPWTGYFIKAAAACDLILAR